MGFRTIKTLKNYYNYTELKEDAYYMKCDDYNKLKIDK